MLGLGSRGPLNKRGEDEDNKSSVKYERRPVAALREACDYDIGSEEINITIL